MQGKGKGGESEGERTGRREDGKGKRGRQGEEREGRERECLRCWMKGTARR